MRISDWSSDVCSSDLNVDRVARKLRGQFGARAGEADDAVAPRKRAVLDHTVSGVAVERDQRRARDQAICIESVSGSVHWLVPAPDFTGRGSPAGGGR